MFDENFMYRLKYELNVQFQFIRLLGISFEKQIFFYEMHFEENSILIFSKYRLSLIIGTLRDVETFSFLNR